MAISMTLITEPVPAITNGTDASNVPRSKFRTMSRRKSVAVSTKSNFAEKRPTLQRNAAGHSGVYTPIVSNEHGANHSKAYTSSQTSNAASKPPTPPPSVPPLIVEDSSDSTAEFFLDTGREDAVNINAHSLSTALSPKTDESHLGSKFPPLSTDASLEYLDALESSFLAILSLAPEVETTKIEKKTARIGFDLFTMVTELVTDAASSEPPTISSPESSSENARPDDNSHDDSASDAFSPDEGQEDVTEKPQYMPLEQEAIQAMARGDFDIWFQNRNPTYQTYYYQHNHHQFDDDMQFYEVLPENHRPPAYRLEFERRRLYRLSRDAALEDSDGPQEEGRAAEATNDQDDLLHTQSAPSPSHDMGQDEHLSPRPTTLLAHATAFNPQAAIFTLNEERCLSQHKSSAGHDSVQEESSSFNQADFPDTHNPPQLHQAIAESSIPEHLSNDILRRQDPIQQWNQQAVLRAKQLEEMQGTNNVPQQRPVHHPVTVPIPDIYQLRNSDVGRIDVRTQEYHTKSNYADMVVQKLAERAERAERERAAVTPPRATAQLNAGARSFIPGQSMATTPSTRPSSENSGIVAPSARITPEIDNEQPSNQHCS